MTIGIDIDGTLTKYPEFFRIMGTCLRQQGHKVYLITGLGAGGLAQRRSKWPILDDHSFFDSIIHTGSYNAEERALIGVELDNEKIVGRFKQRICQELGVSVMFDDQASIHRLFGPVPVFEVK